MEEAPGPDPRVVIAPTEDGPLIIRGDFVILDGEGGEIDPGRRTVALCRCGQSGLKPFCDGTHRSTGFRAPAAGPDRPDRAVGSGDPSAAS
ncbi:MAG: CDGSH iron-sulfur domain-containing protein [Actinomycetota bacterium]|nr:CDGSH iron-sulfur domain-containing protein [Acidothermales bacterium]MDQ3431052.1 CDGSH iron-sulfur domain-containing protein [Actinomycetota bacterium]